MLIYCIVVRVSDKPISFELSIGNAGNSLDGEHLTGKLEHVDTHGHEDDGEGCKDTYTLKRQLRESD